MNAVSSFSVIPRMPFTPKPHFVRYSSPIKTDTITFGSSTAIKNVDDLQRELRGLTYLKPADRHGITRGINPVLTEQKNNQILKSVILFLRSPQGRELPYLIVRPRRNNRSLGLSDTHFEIRVLDPETQDPKVTIFNGNSVCYSSINALKVFEHDHNSAELVKGNNSAFADMVNDLAKPYPKIEDKDGLLRALSEIDKSQGSTVNGAAENEKRLTAIIAFLQTRSERKCAKYTSAIAERDQVKVPIDEKKYYILHTYGPNAMAIYTGEDFTTDWSHPCYRTNNSTSAGSLNAWAAFQARKNAEKMHKLISNWPKANPFA